MARTVHKKKFSSVVRMEGGWEMGSVTAAAATYSVTDKDLVILSTYSATGAQTITLPTVQIAAGRMLIIKDAGYTAGTNNITLTCEDAGDKINGSVNDYVINADGNSVTLFCDGTDWHIV